MWQVYFVGMDLAWGQNRQTGLAVVDSGGALEYLGAARHDAEIIDAVRPFVENGCLVAIDAPLIVTNATGQRPAERALNADFGRFDAGAHPSNTGMPVFSSGVRGARIAKLLDLEMNPHSRAARRAVEVYPHPATVSLFRLGRTLKYKHKSHRSLERLKSELLQLIGFIEGLSGADVGLHVAAHPEWVRLRSVVSAATKKVELRTAEDPIDAVLCAYIARYATERRDDITIYGDIETGYILIPTLPPDLRPTPRGAATTTAHNEMPDAEHRQHTDGDHHGHRLRRPAEALDARRLASGQRNQIVRGDPVGDIGGH